MTELPYQGTELDLFRHAVRWKSYYAEHLRPHIKGEVLEVGAGIGGTSAFLCSKAVTRWTCLEPDPGLAARLEAVLEAHPLPAKARAICGTLADLDPNVQYDTLLYIDVLEHIERDRAELGLAAARLKPGGRVVVLCPAHQWLFSPFDEALGHYRRYNRQTLLAVGPATLSVVTSFYLDSVGMAASLANRALLRAESPTLAQIRFWDSRLVPLSRFTDRLTGYRLGKSVIVVWERLAHQS